MDLEYLYADYSLLLRVLWSNAKKITKYLQTNQLRCLEFTFGTASTYERVPHDALRVDDEDWPFKFH